MDKKKIIKIIAIIVLILVLVFLIDLGRKVWILSKYTEKSNEYAKITNFYKKQNEENGVTTEFWRKGNLGLLKRTDKDSIKMIYYGEDYNWMIVDDKSGKTAVKVNKEGIGIEAQSLKTGTLDLQNLWDKIKLAFCAKITSEKLNNIDYYKIHINKDWQIFIDKNDMYVLREVNGSTDTGFIEYKINEVRDEEVVMPNLAGYTINDTTQM